MMFENIRDRIQNVQHDLSMSFRDFTIGSMSTTRNVGESNKFNLNQFHYDLDVNPHSGVDVIEYFQHGWSTIQSQTKQNVEYAQKTAEHIKNLDSEIKHLNDASQKLDSDLDTLAPEIETSLLKIENEIEQSLILLNKLNDAIVQVEQETIDVNFVQRKNESTKKLNQMMLRRTEDLALYEAQLYSKQERQESETLRERQMVFHQAFEEELKLYKEKGIILEQEKINILSNESKLEDIVLDIDEDEVSEFEKFLKEN